MNCELRAGSHSRLAGLGAGTTHHKLPQRVLPLPAWCSPSGEREQGKACKVFFLPEECMLWSFSRTLSEEKWCFQCPRRYQQGQEGPKSSVPPPRSSQSLPCMPGASRAGRSPPHLHHPRQKRPQGWWHIRERPASSTDVLRCVADLQSRAGTTHSAPRSPRTCCSQPFAAAPGIAIASVAPLPPALLLCPGDCPRALLGPQLVSCWDKSCTLHPPPRAVRVGKHAGGASPPPRLCGRNKSTRGTKFPCCVFCPAHLLFQPQVSFRWS